MCVSQCNCGVGIYKVAHTHHARTHTRRWRSCASIARPSSSTAAWPCSPPSGAHYYLYLCVCVCVCVCVGSPLHGRPCSTSFRLDFMRNNTTDVLGFSLVCAGGGNWVFTKLNPTTPIICCVCMYVCMHMYVCMCVCVCVCIYIYIYR